MGNKYTISWRKDNSIVNDIGTEYFIVALWILFFYNPKTDFDWKLLAIS